MNSQYDRILAYLELEMRDQERIDFEKEIESNTELKSELEFYRTLIYGIESEGKEELKEYIRTRVNEESTETKTNLWVYAAATVTILMVGYVAIYQYTKTGSLQPAKDFISLSKESGEKVKFWKKNRTPNSSQESTTSDTLFMYTLDSFGNPMDSDDIINGNDVAVLEPSAAVLEDANTPEIENRESEDFTRSDKTTAGVKNATDGRNRSVERTENMGITVDESITSKPAISVSSNVKKSTDPNNNRYKSKESTATSLAKNKIATTDAVEGTVSWESTIPKMDPSSIHFVRKVSLVPVQLGSNTNNVSENTLASADKKVRFNVSFFDWDDGSKLLSSSLKIYRNKGSVYIDLYNLSGENPLIYLINSEYFLELGPNQIYKIPNIIPSDLSNPTPIKNKQIIKLIQDSDQ